MTCTGSDAGIHFKSSNARWVACSRILIPCTRTRQIHRYPPLNLYDAGDRYILTVQLPGMAPSDIDLTITGETLTLRGERKRAEGVKDDSYRRQERPMGRWSRYDHAAGPSREHAGRGFVLPTGS